MGASSNILYNNYEVTPIPKYIPRCLYFTICWLFIPYPSTYLERYPVHISVRVVFCQYLYNRLRKRLLGYIYTTYARIHTIEMEASANIYIIDYAEDFILDVYPNAFLLRFAD